MLKPGVTPEEQKIYDLYVQRIMKEYDLVWSRFKIYFSFNSGILVAIGFLVRPHLSILPVNIPDHLLGMVIPLIILGTIFSIAWFLVNKDGRKWMLVINSVIEKVEDSLFEEADCALYKRINASYSEARLKIDVVDVNLYLAAVFVFIWSLLGVLSTLALLG